MAQFEQVENAVHVAGAVDFRYQLDVFRSSIGFDFIELLIAEEGFVGLRVDVGTVFAHLGIFGALVEDGAFQ